MSELCYLTPLFRGVALCLVACCLSGSVGIAAAEPPAKNTGKALVHLTSAEAANFRLALTSLSDQAQVTIITEGMPIKQNLPPKSSPDLTASLPVSSAISSIAAAYDYDAQESGKVYVFTKRYSEPQDLPCITLAECREAAASIVSYLDVFNPHFEESMYASGTDGRKDAIIQFFKSLSPLQLAAAQSRTLRYGTLLPDQQKLVDSLFLFSLIQQPADRVTEASNYLNIADKGTITLLNGQGYSGLFLALPGHEVPAALTYVSLLGGVTVPGQQQVGTTQAGSSSLPMKQETPSTLKTIVATLEPIHGQKPVTDPSISEKPVMAFGLQHTAPKDVLKALAVLYGLRIGASDKGSSQLEPSIVATPRSLSELNAALWKAIPISYDRALHFQVVNGKTAYSLVTSNPVSIPAPLAESYDMAQAYQAEINSRVFVGEMTQEAGRQLLSAIQPQIKTSGQHARVPVLSLSESARSALAVLLMTNLVSTLQNGFTGQAKQSVLNCLENMDQTIIYTDPSALAHVYGQDVPSFNLIGTDPYTNKQIGLGGVQYASHG